MNILQRIVNDAKAVQILAEWVGEGGIVVDQEDAQSRADTCLECPKNKLGFTLEKAVAEAIKRQKELKSRMELRVKGEKRLGTCKVCGCPPSLKIWIPLQRTLSHTTADELAEFPENCWLHKEHA
jgi:hypothetical protein